MKIFQNWSFRQVQCAFKQFDTFYFCGTCVRLVNTFRRLRASGARAYLMFARLRINTNSEFTFYQTDNQNLNKNFENQCC